MDAMEQFNVSTKDSVAKFNEQSDYTRESFNAQNSTAIDQSNLLWRRQLASQATADQQQANMVNAQNGFAARTASLAYTWQEARDTADQQWKNYQNNLDRVLNYETQIKATEITANAGIAKANIAAASNAEAAKIAADAAMTSSKTEAYAVLIGAVTTAVGDNWNTETVATAGEDE